MGCRADAVIVVDAGPIIDAARRPEFLLSLIKRAQATGQRVMTTEAIVAQVWRSPPEVGVARVLQAIDIESGFGDGKAIGALCADEDDPDVVDASLAWWALRRNGRILSNDPDVERYAAKVGVVVTSLPSG